MPHVPRLLRLALLAVALPILAGCDTTDPEPPASPGEVVGTYTFSEYRFVPNGTAIAPADVLASLEEAGTSLELVQTGQGPRFILRYQFEGDLPNIINGAFSVTRNTVTLEPASQYRQLLEELLLSETIRLERTQEDVLALDAARTVNLEAFDPEQYGGAGLTAVRGRLVIRLVRQ